jgi:hypothetical protein
VRPTLYEISHLIKGFANYFDLWYLNNSLNHQHLIAFRHFVKMRKETVSFLMYVRLSAQNIKFSWNLIFEFSKISRENQISLKSEKKKGYYTWRAVYSFISHSFLLIMRNVLDRSCRQNQNTFLYSKTYFRKTWRLWDNVEKYCRARQATEDNMAHAHYMLDN